MLTCRTCGGSVGSDRVHKCPGLFAKPPKPDPVRATLVAIQELHKPRRLYLLDGDTGGGYYFDTPEEALAEARSNPLEGYETRYFESASEIPFFEICEECGRIESEQLKEMGEGACYRESLYPCSTRRLADQGLGGGQDG